MQSNLDNLSIVLVETKTPANIGAVARGMMNMGLSRLVLVDPPRDRDHEALKLAAGAGELIEKAVICGTLEKALAGQGLVIGTSRHPGRRRKNIHSPGEMAREAVSLLDRNKVSVVFGNEVNGLTNRDLALCHELISIPSSDKFPSLNLSHAAMIVMYEFFVASMAGPFAPSTELASAEELEQYFQHLDRTLRAIAFTDSVQAKRLLFSLRQVYGRARLDSREVSILQGILSSVDRLARAVAEKDSKA